MSGSISPNTPAVSPPPGQVSNFDDPRDPKRVVQFVVTLAILVPFSTLCALARLWTRAVILRRFGWDDVFAMLALVTGSAFYSAVTANAGGIAAQHRTYNWLGWRSGLGDYDWNVRMIDWKADDEPYYSYWNAINCILYYITFTFLKLSILALYLRVLGGSRPKVRVGIYMMMFAVCAIHVGCLIDLLTFCTPVAKLFDMAIPGSCNIQIHLFFIQAVLSVATDLLILVPPIPVILRLPCSPHCKIGIVFILCMGLVVTGIGAARAAMQQPRYSTFEYPMYDQYDCTYWGILEVNLAIATVSLPALTQLLRRVRSISTWRGDQSHSSPAAVSPADPGDVPWQPPSTLQDGVESKSRRSHISLLTHGMYLEIGRSQDSDRSGLVTEQIIDEEDSLGEEGANVGVAISQPEREVVVSKASSHEEPASDV